MILTDLGRLNAEVAENAETRGDISRPERFPLRDSAFSAPSSAQTDRGSDEIRYNQKCEMLILTDIVVPYIISGSQENAEAAEKRGDSDETSRFSAVIRVKKRIRTTNSVRTRNDVTVGILHFA
ncbi:hypothetical protein QUF72_12155 [Desulfobacterales bacterium HSG2]|nr:hypothetical protein [Desulfobacterales bacterium HSG2]